MTIRAVFFDMGGTIETFWYTRQLRLDATPGLRRLLLDAGINLNLSNEQLYELVSTGLDCYHQWNLQSMEELPALRVWHEFVFVNQPISSDQLAACAEALMQYIELNYYHREMRPEIPAVLAAIKKMGLKIGLISNVCSRNQVAASLQKYDIRDYFDPVVLSSEYGRRKPDPAIFHYAARLANVPTSACLYVGDRIARDIVGARRAGFKCAIQIINDFDHGEEDKGAEPDAVIHQMTELLEILKAVPVSSKCTSVNKKQVCALLFDAGDILYYRPDKGYRISAYLKELELDPAKIPLDRLDLLQTRAFRGQILQDQYRVELLKLYGVTRPEDIERGKRIMEEEDDHIKFIEGAKETLHALKEKGILLGIITDTARPLHAKLRWLEQAGFGDVWDSIISSLELGIRKPDPEIYYAALKQLGLAPGQAAFVGHKISELKGAKAVGMKTVAFNYEQNSSADYYIEHFTDLLQLPLVSEKEIDLA